MQCSERIIDSFQKDKSLGLDGSPSKFYVGFFELLEKDLLLVVEESRKVGKFLGALNTTFLAIIPKRYVLGTFDEFRPMPLCNVSYKIISKLIARRLKEVLSLAISGE